MEQKVYEELKKNNDGVVTCKLRAGFDKYMVQGEVGAIITYLQDLHNRLDDLGYTRLWIESDYGYGDDYYEFDLWAERPENEQEYKTRLEILEKDQLKKDLAKKAKEQKEFKEWKRLNKKFGNG